MGMIYIHTSTTIEYIKEEDVIAIEAIENHVKIYLLQDRVILSNQSFGKLTSQLASLDFCRCHKSFTVNLQHVKRYHKTGNLEMTNMLKVPVSKRRKEACLDHIIHYFQNQIHRK